MVSEVLQWHEEDYKAYEEHFLILDQSLTGRCYSADFGF